MSRDKYGFLKNISFIKSRKHYTEHEIEEEESDKEEYGEILNLLMIEGKWDIIHEHMDIFYLEGITKKQTREDCLKFVSNSYDCNALRFIMKQDDEIVLLAIKQNLYNLVHVRIPLKKETLVEIDLLHGKMIEKYPVIKLAYMLLMEKVI